MGPIFRLQTSTNPLRELPFKKGDILDLTHTVDDNWLKGMLDGRKGIFPKSYVKVSVSVCVCVCVCVCVNNDFPLKMVGLDIIHVQSHLLRRMCFGQYQASSALPE